MQVRQVTLNGGPYDGVKSVASHDTAVHASEIYVWDGGEDKDRFTHALTAVNKLPYPQRVAEARRVDEWMKHPGSPSGIKGKDGKDLMLPAPMAMCIGIPPWRINAWMQLIRYGMDDELMKDPEYRKILLNPGIAHTVAWLRSHGFETCDSGDGETHDFECDQAQPYVHMRVAQERLVSEADRLVELLKCAGVEVQEMDENCSVPCVEAACNPAHGFGTITLWNVKLS